MERQREDRVRVAVRADVPDHEVERIGHQRAAARALGIDQPTYCRLEAGKARLGTRRRDRAATSGAPPELASAALQVGNEKTAGVGNGGVTELVTSSVVNSDATCGSATG